MGQNPSQHPVSLPDGIEQRFADLTKKFSSRRSYLVGVSGGCDSVVLLDILVRAGYKKLTVCHLNHGLRGRDSDQDAAFVKRLAARYALKFEGAKVDVAKCAQEDGQSLETAGRAARHAFFSALVKRRRISGIFLGHHADDQVETVVMNFFRGAGSKGLAGMEETAHVSSEGVLLTLIRPLLFTWKSELLAHAEAEGLRFREDASNSEDTFLRNRVRHTLLPEAAALFRRDSRAAIARMATLLSAEERLLHELAEETMDAVCDSDGALAIRELKAAPLALQRRMLRLWLYDNGVPDISFDLVEAIIAIADPEESTASVNTPGARRVRRRAGKLFFD